MKSCITRHLYYVSTASANDGAHLDLGGRCALVGVDWSIDAAVGNNGDAVRAELSTTGVAGYATNDALNLISHIAIDMYTVATAAGTTATMVNQNKFAGPMYIEFPAGTRMFLNTIQQGTASTKIGCTLHLTPL